jgi:DNA-binding HxlR family transcriptional regulator
MTEHPQSHAEARRIERAVVLQLLRDDHDERWSRAELEAEINDVEPSVLSSAIAELERRGVVVAQGEHVVASPCARHLDELGLVGV